MKTSHDTNAFTEINPQNLNKIKKEKLMLKRRLPEYLVNVVPYKSSNAGNT
jgi:hypothetical protein